MSWLVVLTLKSILGSIIGSSFYQWFKNTKMGVWFQVRMDNTMEWVAKRYDIEIATREEKWLKQYPNLAARIQQLEKNSHPPVVAGGATEIEERLKKLEEKSNE